MIATAVTLNARSATPLSVEFGLGSDAEARLELFDVAGRRVESVHLPRGVVQGSRKLEAASSPPGVYMGVLTQDGARLARRAVIAR